MKKIPPETLLKVVSNMAHELRVPATIPGQELHLLNEMYLQNDEVRAEVNIIL